MHVGAVAGGSAPLKSDLSRPYRLRRMGVRRRFGTSEMNMNTERIVRIAAGAFILLTLGLGVQGSPIFHDVNWLWLTAFVGANLFQSGFTRFCPLELILRKAGVRGGSL